MSKFSRSMSKQAILFVVLFTINVYMMVNCEDPLQNGLTTIGNAYQSDNDADSVENTSYEASDDDSLLAKLSLNSKRKIIAIILNDIREQELNAPTPRYQKRNLRFRLRSNKESQKKRPGWELAYGRK